jgi:hypothetical protein
LGPLEFIKFLGYTSEGIIWLLLSVFTCGILTSLLGLIEGIIYLTKSDEEFYQTYQVGKKSLLKQKIPILKSGFFYENLYLIFLSYFRSSSV